MNIFKLDDISSFDLHYKGKLCSSSVQQSDQKTFVSGSWIYLLTFILLCELHSPLWETQFVFTSQKQLYSYLELSKRDSIQAWTLCFPRPLQQQKGKNKEARSQRSYIKMTSLPHRAILHSNPQACDVSKRPWSPAFFCCSALLYTFLAKIASRTWILLPLGPSSWSYLILKTNSLKNA